MEEVSKLAQTKKQSSGSAFFNAASCFLALDKESAGGREALRMVIAAATLDRRASAVLIKPGTRARVKHDDWRALQPTRRFVRASALVDAGCWCGFPRYIWQNFIWI